MPTGPKGKAIPKFAFDDLSGDEEEEEQEAEP